MLLLIHYPDLRYKERITVCVIFMWYLNVYDTWNKVNFPIIIKIKCALWCTIQYIRLRILYMFDMYSDKTDIIWSTFRHTHSMTISLQQI